MDDILDELEKKEEKKIELPARIYIKDQDLVGIIPLFEESKIEYEIEKIVRIRDIGIVASFNNLDNMGAYIHFHPHNKSQVAKIIEDYANLKTDIAKDEVFSSVPNSEMNPILRFLSFVLLILLLVLFVYSAYKCIL